MPRRRKSYRLTATAVRDFRIAQAWSLSRWGTERTQAYFRRLHDAAESAAVNQAAVQDRDDLAGDTSLAIYPVGEHYLVYVPIGEKQIAIVALIRQTRDVPAILQANSFRIRQALDEALRQR